MGQHSSRRNGLSGWFGSVRIGSSANVREQERTMKAKESKRYLSGLVLGALGVVYGDIGTSPLYALRECFHWSHDLAPTRDNVMGVLSLIIWSLIIIVSVKYISFVLRADNRGEGGILALMALAFQDRKTASPRSSRGMMITLGVFGAALLYGDGMITPAITVLSAVEGLEVATPVFDPYTIPITVCVLVGLFSFQRIGAGKVGIMFGPITLVWFISIALLGLRGIAQAPEICLAIAPSHAVRFFVQNGWPGFVVLGSVFLAVTGAEALYADLGHFGMRSIRLAWFWVALPALVLNYLGQGALLLHVAGAAENPFYRLAPSWAIIPLVILATVQAVIASQALISGAFSLTMQAIQLGYLPRIPIDHTSSSEKGQIYIPHVNWALMLACIGLVIGFGSSSNLAAAYGIAVTLTMLITTALFYCAARYVWKWSAWKAGPICLLFFVVELAFFGANLLKVFHGGWFPLVIGAGLFTVMSTWKTGRAILAEKLRASSVPFDLFLQDVLKRPPLRIPGTAVFMSGNPGVTPLALLHNLKHNKVLHQRVIVLTILTEEIPHVDRAHRVKVEVIREGFYRVTGSYGFMQDPSVPELLECCASYGLKFKPHDTTFFLSRETIIPTHAPGMAVWRERLFAVMSRNAQHATAFFRLPANRVVELGMQVEF